jgi:tRNA(Ile)-lysidine synthase TilS/MesJ
MLNIPPILLAAFEAGADCMVSVNGGKDSQALLLTVVAWWRTQHYAGKVVAIFADLGRAEWSQTVPFVTSLCQSLQIELVVVQRGAGDLLDKFEERRAMLGESACHLTNDFADC